MKKITFLAAAAAVCALCMTGCNNDIEKPALPATGKQVTMTVQASAAAPQTRADYTQEEDVMKFSWRSGDAISVVVNGVEGNENCELTTTKDANKAPFSGTVTSWSGEKNIYTFYPYSEKGYTVTNGNTPETATVEFTLPAPQTYNASTHAATNGFMVGSGKASADETGITASVGMKQVMSFVKLNITNATAKVKQVSLESYEHTKLASKATVKLSDATCITSPNGAADKLFMNVIYTGDSTPDMSKPQVVSLALFPVDLTGIEMIIEVEFQDGVKKTITKDGMKFERNKHYEVDFDVAPTPQPANSMQFTVLIEDGSLDFKIPFYIVAASKAPANITIDWGDNSTGTTVPKGEALANTDFFKHSYPEAGKYPITITSDAAVTESQIPGLRFYNTPAAKQLVTFDTPLLNMMNTTSLEYCFYGCTALTAVPENIFANNTKATSFEYCFSGCTALTTVPENIFANNKEATNFEYCFNDCTALDAVPKGLFAGNTAATSFKSCFYNCKALTKVPEGLFAGNTAATTFENCFNRCFKLVTGLEGLFANNTNATSFKSCFSNCQALTTVPEGLFANNTAATTFENCFTNCYKLVLNEKIFIGPNDTSQERFKDKDIDFSECFYQAGKNSSVTGNAPDLWNYKQGTGKWTKTDCFKDCKMTNTMPEEFKTDWGSPATK